MSVVRFRPGPPNSNNALLRAGHFLLVARMRWPLDKTYAFTYHIEKGEIMATLTASEARASLYRLIDQAAESHKPVLISGKRSNAVLISEEDWSAIQETLYLLSIPGMRESIKESMAEPLAKSKRTLKW